MPVPNNLRIRKKRKKVNATFITNMRKRGERMKVKTIPEINMTDNPLDNMRKMNTGKILTTEAAAILNTSPQFVRVAMQQGKLPIGIAIKMSTKWTYNISGKLLTEYSGKDVEKELEQIRKKKVM